MKVTRVFRALAASVAAAALTSASSASFHFMQIEQIIGGVNGNANAQAVQLRMRSSFQNIVSFSRVVAYDATGANPVIIKDMTTNVTNFASGARVLIASAAFTTSPVVSPDFVMDNLIPASYLAAGSLTFEDDFGTIYWRVCWGGAAYTGSTLVSDFTNDADGNVGPAFAGALPSSTLQSLRFPGGAASMSTNNAADYAVSSRAAIFANNAGSSGTVVAPPPPTCEGNVNGDASVNVTDLLAVISAWGPCVTCPTPCPADVAPATPDCAINVTDLLLVISNWGPCP